MAFFFFSFFIGYDQFGTFGQSKYKIYPLECYMTLSNQIMLLHISHPTNDEISGLQKKNTTSVHDKTESAYFSEMLLVIQILQDCPSASPSEITTSHLIIIWFFKTQVCRGFLLKKIYAFSHFSMSEAYKR